ncbi:NADH-ubiquinone oxidoreductase-F iron-sulfur binding region domain-containing protein [Microbacterium rhizosphaerae]|uniref:NADH-ubiquinone oxidoreductase-F iron-sulfur binding region domain-containing protein n=1 Tax=Microbacterium rhizosphaerae TaxID=1678237 RepID=A0ABZ0SIR0_9MICO|nr:NADH-ubiquinone oxidoreductase-F iron-sulfur binding region domain-containing protein [Microbacterium rhizosphaerae]WPR88943.1 NADH-ubiquinone oxidoreductase-F iron-sulfur binding region domain-containing protein [Microbacterium rhizosphaerae]
MNELATSVSVVRLLAAGERATLATHLATFGDLDLQRAADSLIAELDASGLTGRGGAGFPAWRKHAASRDAATGMNRPIVIANGAEGEPASGKDAVLLQDAPHLVIDGLLATAAAVGARRMYVYANRADLEYLAAAIAERRAVGGPTARNAARIRIVEATDTFISGEASAVVNAIEKGKAIPQDRTVRLTQRGLGGHPTLVHNLETLAHVALISRYGAAWFRSEGTPDDPGTRLVTISGDVPEPRVLEVAGGAPIADIIRQAGADPGTLSAVLVGGYHGSWLTRDQLGTPLAKASLAPYGASPGAGILIALGTQRCGVAATAEILGYLADQSARQCGPCKFGLPALAENWRSLAHGSSVVSTYTRITDLGNTIDGRGSCAHPDGSVRLSRSAQKAFADDLAEHARGRCLRTA